MHVLEHALSGMFDVSHGKGLALIFPKYLEMFESRLSGKLIPFGKVFDDERCTPADSAIAAFRKWLDSIGRDLFLATWTSRPKRSRPCRFRSPDKRQQARAHRRTH
ncbi:MAG: iron-containing alcohol dehydrogenase [Candidatus Marinimicrobia bacterium]|nr:iron-containing alcohol dehydrogenase [Candidatus Neomarinimicrobiota bacterium]